MKQIKKFNEFFQTSMLENNEEEELEYSFEELSPEAKEKALDHFRDANVDYDGWHDHIIEDFKEDLLHNFGFDEVDVQYSGFYSQGDGASFTGYCGNSEKFMKNGLGITKSTDLIDMGEEKKSDDDDLVDLMGDLRDIGFDTRERYKPDDFYFSVVRNTHRYSHENTIEGEIEVDEIELDRDDDRDPDGMIDGLTDQTTEWARSKSRELYDMLYKEYEYLTSDDAVEDTIIANDYKFKEDGSLA